MNKKLILRWLAGSVLISWLSACSTIKSWFPDKERDYQFTSEMPELIVPDDLKNQGLVRLPASPPATSTAGSDTAPDSKAAEVDAGQTAETQAEPIASHTVDEKIESQPAAPAAASASGISSLQIDQPQTPAARMVGRALTRQKVEIVERNIDKGYFYVKYDPNAVKASDDSIWDEFDFLFGDDPSQEQEYRVTVHGLSPQMSEVTVQDQQGKTLSTAAANGLLKLITDGINQVVNQENTTDLPAEPEAKPEQQKTPENPVIHD